jgi:tRNA A-37 threonylcarbamoyl transferase component Bud32
VYVADVKEAEEGHWLLLNRTDGLPAVDTNRQSFRQDRDGSVWFGADNSVIHLFPPDDLVHPRYSPSVFISAFSWNGGAPVLAANVEEFRSGSDLVAHVGALQMDRRNALHLRYRLLPDQTAWQASPNLDLHLGKLHWGAHTLQVQAALGTGPWSEASFAELRVLKPFWLSWPALIGFTAMGSAAAGVAARWQRKQAQRAKKVFPEIAEWRLAVLSPEIQSLKGGVLDSRFEVGKILGRGGFATVAEGKDLKKDARRCAVKIFHQKFADKDWLTKRFRHEVLALEQIRHPNVVSIYGHGMTPEGAPYLVMEFIEGQTMRSFLEAGMIPREKAASYLRQIGCALREIHAHSICHRDLKPENLMIRDVASPGQEIALIDFSIAIVKDPDETLHGLSRAAGTIYYMAPEQAIGYADATSDIYSLAKIVIEMLTGQRLSALLPNASIDLPERVAELLSETPSGLSAFSIELIAQALEYHPRRRPSDAGEFANRIAGDLERGGNDVETKSK